MWVQSTIAADMISGFHLENWRNLEEIWILRGGGGGGGMMVIDVTKFHKRHLGGRGMLGCVCGGFHIGFCVLGGRGWNSKVRC